MFQAIVIILIMGFIALGLIGEIVRAFLPVALYIILPMCGVLLVLNVVRAIYHLLNPKAKQAYLERKVRDAEETKKKKAREEAENRAWMEREAEKRRKKEFERQQHRDAEQQVTPYAYQIGRHANESLAIRYGIANQEKKVKEHWHYTKGGKKKRNPDRDKIYYVPATSIRLQKTKKIGKDLYEVLLTDYRDRKANAVIEVGTEYVKTFLPLDESWFEKHADIEKTLKGNGSFTLKELATFHVQKTVGI